MYNDELYNDPDAIEGNIDTQGPNETIIIYSGPFQLADDKIEVSCEGQLVFHWLPEPHVKVDGSCPMKMKEFNDFIRSSAEFNFKIDSVVAGIFFMTKVNFAPELQWIKGELDSTILGESWIKVKSAKFVVPNFRELIGSSVKKIDEKGEKFCRGRLLLENEKFIIALDKCFDYRDRKILLDAFGGYIVTYHGQIEAIGEGFTPNEIQDYIHCLRSFLSFINGRKISPIFLQGMHESKTIWTDFSNFGIEIYKPVFSWVNDRSTNGLNQLWQSFYKIWFTSEDDKYFLAATVEWYLSGNNGIGHVEGAIIMTQTALELIYNWWLIDREKMLIGKDSENIEAANKIRLIISALSIKSNVPTKFLELEKYATSLGKKNDGAEAIVQVRNAIVHSQQEKRKTLSKISTVVKYEVLQLSLWYIELALLKILDFPEPYINRCSRQHSRIEKLPWLK